MQRVTRHADTRLRKRLGLPRKVVEKQAALAYEHGQYEKDFVGSFKRYLAAQAITHRTTPRVYKGNIYFFSGTALVTCWPVPTKFRKYLKAKVDG